MTPNWFFDWQGMAEQIAAADPEDVERSVRRMFGVRRPLLHPFKALRQRRLYRRLIRTIEEGPTWTAVPSDLLERLRLAEEVCAFELIDHVCHGCCEGCCESEEPCVVGPMLDAWACKAKATRDLAPVPDEVYK